jgi:uncharacterized protein (TIGR02145 family)
MFQIGNQVWMAENLKVSRFNNGTDISQVFVDSSFYNYGNPAWSYYNDSVEYNNPYGKLYNNFVVTSNFNVCPTGWHIPSYNDCLELKSYLPLVNNGGVLKSTGYNFWKSPNGGATNETGFSAVGGGKRDYLTYIYFKEGSFYWVSGNYYFVLSNENNINSSYNDFGINNSVFAGDGYSIRCVKD